MVPETNAAMDLRYMRTAKYDSASKLTKAALNLQANSWEALHLTAVNMSYLGLHKRALLFYDKAAELNPFNVYTISNRGWELLILGEVDRALQNFERACSIRPVRRLIERS